MEQGMDLFTDHKVRLENVSCAFCGQDNTQIKFHIEVEKILSRTAAQIPTDAEKYATIVKCRNCGLVYTNPRWVFPEGSMPYSEEAEEKYFALTYQERKIAFQNLVEKASSFNPHLHNLTALDIGCGDGLLMEVSRQAGIRCDGFEVSDSLVKRLRAKFGEGSVYNNGLDSLAENTYDIVFLINVIEHLPDPFTVLKQIYRILKPGGIVFIHAPNFGGVPARLTGPAWHQVDPFVHLYYFDYPTLNKMLLKSGLLACGRFYLSSPSPSKQIIQEILDRLGIYLDNGLGVVARRANGL